jgi:hypothetical protein
VPEVVTGEPETVMNDGRDSPTLVTVPVPPGKSAATRARNVGADAPPEDGPARTRFAFCVASVTASVPLVVMGEPDTERNDGTVSATLDTLPFAFHVAALEM